MTIYTDAGTATGKTTPKRTAEGITHVDSGTVRSRVTVTAADHYCIYIPVFDYSSGLDYEYAQHGTGPNYVEIETDKQYAYFVEFNPQANPC